MAVLISLTLLGPERPSGERVNLAGGHRHRWGAKLKGDRARERSRRVSDILSLSLSVEASVRRQWGVGCGYLIQL